MADYSIIADASNTVLRMLKENLCPEPLQSPELVALAAPYDKNGDFQAGLFLYDMRELSEYRGTTPIRSPDNVTTFPSKPMTLNYLLFLNTKAQIAAAAEMEQRIFGKTIQTLMDNSVVNLTAVNPFVDEPEEECQVSLLNPTFEDKTKIWAALSTPYQLAVYFSVSPIFISSRRERSFSRVVAARVGIEPIRGRYGRDAPGGGDAN
ncbi:DUF4255 domain-containing protein [Ruminococcaceae bacterium OttesenSCG-928-L11]|nr:DUF4255 domain-containing protein [Ruminococcaceae bacterium OttesenSCG-928-L11]